MALTIDPMKMLFSRQQMAAATGLGDDLLAYWIKEGLLPARCGGEGKGRHRQFGYEAIHRAAIYGELRRYNIGIGALRKLAAILDEAVQIRESMPEYNYRDVVAAGFIHRGKIQVGEGRDDDLPDDGHCHGDAENWLDRQCMPEKVTELVERYVPATERAFSVYHDLFAKSIFTQTTVRWMISFDQEGEIELWPQSSAAETAPVISTTSYITLNISLIVQRLWGLAT